MASEKITAIVEEIKGLTPEEEAERAALHREYIDAHKQQLIAHLENTYVQYPDGRKVKIQKKK